MGICSPSKFNSPSSSSSSSSASSLCRRRFSLLSVALLARFSLADSHSFFSPSLLSLSSSLHPFLLHHHDITTPSSSGSHIHFYCSSNDDITSLCDLPDTQNDVVLTNMKLSYTRNQPALSSSSPSWSSWSSGKVREEEGIPELEEEEVEVVKEEIFVGPSTVTVSENSGNEPEIEEDFRRILEPEIEEEEEEEEGVMEKKVVGGEGEASLSGTGSHIDIHRKKYYNDIADEIGKEDEIMVQYFDRASQAASELSKVLEVGKHPYQYRKSSFRQVSSRLSCLMPAFNANSNKFLSLEEDIMADSRNLSSTLQKLYIWEKKLEHEVRAEEKLRLLHDKKCRRFKHMFERGAEAHKLDQVQKLIKKLSTQIRIAMQVVDSVSNKINELRDEELWPHIHELIQGLARMWKVMLEYHQIQCRAISEAKSKDTIESDGNLNETRLNAMVELELEMLRWTDNFSSWMNAQRDFVKALNGWLILCLHYEPTGTDGAGIAPYSPGRLGAPPVFVICNYWSQAMDVISEKEVINSMQAFANNLIHLLEKNSFDSDQKTNANGDTDRLVKARVKEMQIIQMQVIDALNKKLELVSGEKDDSDYSDEVSSLHLGLKQIFEALEKISATSLKVYEDLLKCSEQVS